LIWLKRLKLILIVLNTAVLTVVLRFRSKFSCFIVLCAAISAILLKVFILSGVKLVFVSTTEVELSFHFWLLFFWRDVGRTPWQVTLLAPTTCLVLVAAS